MNNVIKNKILTSFISAGDKNIELEIYEGNKYVLVAYIDLSI